ncbi:MAG: reverse transcriptase domain-containing protein [Candidatus Thiodiazotropha sp.]
MVAEAPVTLTVSKNYDQYLSYKLSNTPENFVAGKTARYQDQWTKITSDKWVLKTICGYKVELIQRPVQNSIPVPIKFSDSEKTAISSEISAFVNKGIIEPIFSSDPGEYVSNIFMRSKSDGGTRVILNLKPFNEQFVEKIHFKMESLKSAINAMSRNCYFASVDLKDAYYSIPIRMTDRKFFRFYWQNQKYQFTSLIMGLSSSPRVFTKILKPIFATLRAKGHISTAYIDDSCLQGQTAEDCAHNVSDTVSLFDNLGFTIHDKKSVFIPTKQIVFVGFLLDSETMTVRLTCEKAVKIITVCTHILQETYISIREFARLIGKLVATEPGVEYAQLRYKPLEQIKDKYLKFHKGNFEAHMPVSSECRIAIQWWIDNLRTSFKVISHGKPAKILYTDSSNSGWGAFDKTLDVHTGGHWSEEESQHHINYLELKAAFLGLKALCGSAYNVHIQVYMDNTTSCAYIANFGGKKKRLNELAIEIWNWCIARKIHLSVGHVSGSLNVEADRMSRKINDDLEWALREDVFDKIVEKFGLPDIDLFASRLNHKLKRYVSFRPDPCAIAVDAFSISWANDYVFIFAPFSTLNMVLRKIAEDSAEGIVIAPLWTTQSWWPLLVHHITDLPLLLPRGQGILYQPNDLTKIHPLKKLRLGAFRVSGSHWKAEAFRASLPPSSLSHGGNQLKNSMTAISNSGWNLQIQGRQIQLIPL